MLTFDLPSLAPLLSDACDAGTARRLAALLESDAEAAARVQELAGARPRGSAGARPRRQHPRHHPRAGAKVFIDVDVEATF